MRVPYCVCVELLEVCAPRVSVLTVAVLFVAGVYWFGALARCVGGGRESSAVPPPPPPEVQWPRRRLPTSIRRPRRSACSPRRACPSTPPSGPRCTQAMGVDGHGRHDVLEPSLLAFLLDGVPPCGA